MAQQDWIGIAVLATSFVLLAVLLSFRAIRHNPVMVVILFLNPGLVGVLAGLAFLLRENQDVATPCWYGAMLLALVTTLALAFVLPRMFLQQIREATAEDEAASDQSNGQT